MQISVLPRDQQNMGRRVSEALGSPLRNAQKPTFDSESEALPTSQPSSPLPQDDTFLYTSYARRIIESGQEGSLFHTNGWTATNSMPVIRNASETAGTMQAWTSLFLHYGTEAGEQQTVEASEKTPLVDKHAPSIPQTTTPAAFLILFKAFLGTGELFMPKAFRNGGTLFSSIAIAVLGCAICHCILSLVECRRKCHDASYAQVGGIAFGPIMALVIHMSLILDLVFTVIALMIFVSQNILTAVQVFTNCASWAAALTPSHLALIQAILHIPLCCVRDIKYFAFPALCGELFILVGLGYIYWWDLGSLSSSDELQHTTLFNKQGFGVSLGLMAFAWDSIALALPLEESMKHREHYGPILKTILSLMGILYISFGLLNCLVFGDRIVDIIFLTLPQNFFLASVELLYASAVFFTIPLNFFALARMLEGDLQRLTCYHTNETVVHSVGRPFFIILFGVISSFNSTQLANFAAVASAFSSIPLCFIYPPLIHLQLVNSSSMVKAANVAIAVGGVACTAYVGIHTIESWFSGVGTSFLPFCARSPSVL